jgi:hypothetical protein
MTLPEPLVEANVRQFPSSGKRAITCLKEDEEEEAETRRQRRVAAVRAQANAAQEEHAERENKRTAAAAEDWLQSQSQRQLSELSSNNPELSLLDESIASLSINRWITLSAVVFARELSL